MILELLLSEFNAIVRSARDSFYFVRPICDIYLKWKYVFGATLSRFLQGNGFQSFIDLDDKIYNLLRLSGNFICDYLPKKILTKQCLDDADVMSNEEKNYLNILPFHFNGRK